MSVGQNIISGAVSLDPANVTAEEDRYIGKIGQFTMDMPKSILDMCSTSNHVVSTDVWEYSLTSFKNKDIGIVTLVRNLTGPLYAEMRLRTGDDLGKDVFRRLTIISDHRAADIERVYTTLVSPHVWRGEANPSGIQTFTKIVEHLFKNPAPSGPLGFVESFLNELLAVNVSEVLPVIGQFLPPLLVNRLALEVQQERPNELEAARLLLLATQLMSQVEAEEAVRPICIGYHHLIAAKKHPEVDTALSALDEDLFCVKHVHQSLRTPQVGVFSQCLGTSLADLTTNLLGQSITEKEISVSINNIVSPLYPDWILNKSNRPVKILDGRYSATEEWWTRYPEQKQSLIKSLAPEYWEKPVRMLLKAVDEKLKEKEIG